MLVEVSTAGVQLFDRRSEFFNKSNNVFIASPGFAKYKKRSVPVV